MSKKLSTCHKCRASNPAGQKICWQCGSKIKPKTRIGFLLIGLFLAVVLAASQESNLTPEERAARDRAYAERQAEREREAARAAAAQAQAKANAAAPAQSTPTFSESQLCKAAIAAIMGRNPGTMKSIPTAGGAFKVSYVRPSDQQPFSHYCKVSGRSIVWGGSIGNWIKDAEISHGIQDGKLTIVQRFDDQSEIVKSFNPGELGGKQ